MAESVSDYLDSAPEVGRPWLQEFWAYVGEHFPDRQPTMFRGVPMYRFGDSYLQGYVMFTAAQGHFSVHALDFDLVERFRAAIPKAKGGKGSVAVPYSDPSVQPLLKNFVDAVMDRHDVSKVD